MKNMTSEAREELNEQLREIELEVKSAKKELNRLHAEGKTFPEAVEVLKTNYPDHYVDEESGKWFTFAVYTGSNYQSKKLNQ